VQKIIRALALAYALCASDSATPRAAGPAADGGPQAPVVSHHGAVASLIGKAALSTQ
jgi:hypothetical protein